MPSDIYLWQVRLRGFTLRVRASDQAEAGKKAAEYLGFPWKSVATEMELLRLRKCRSDTVSNLDTLKSKRRK